MSVRRPPEEVPFPKGLAGASLALPVGRSAVVTALTADGQPGLASWLCCLPAV